MFRYQTQGQLVAPIDADNVSLAQDYLEDDAMAQYLDEPLLSLVATVDWSLDDNGLDYTVTASAHRKLTKAQLKELSEWVSGQNSDGLGEGFEQQEFAETEDGSFTSFDWPTNPCTFTYEGSQRS